MMAALGTTTIASRDIGTCDCGSSDLEADVETTTSPATPNPKALTGVMNVAIHARATKIRCRSCGFTKDVDVELTGGR